MTAPKVRAANPDDWPAVAGLLVELGRGVAAGTAEDDTHRLQFAAHLRRLCLRLGSPSTPTNLYQTRGETSRVTE